MQICLTLGDHLRMSLPVFRRAMHHYFPVKVLLDLDNHLVRYLVEYVLPQEMKMRSRWTTHKSNHSMMNLHS